MRVSERSKSSLYGINQSRNGEAGEGKGRCGDIRLNDIFLFVARPRQYLAGMFYVAQHTAVYLEFYSKNCNYPENVIILQSKQIP